MKTQSFIQIDDNDTADVHVCKPTPIEKLDFKDNDLQKQSCIQIDDNDTKDISVCKNPRI